MTEPSRESLLQSIQPNMKLDRAFFLKVYGYEISFPGFRDIALKALEDAGCTRAREYYESIVADHEQKHNEELKEVAEWYSKQLDEKWERKVKDKECQKQEKNTKSDYWKRQSEKVSALKNVVINR